MTPAEIGKMGETAVCRYLEAQGYIIRNRNFRVRGGEIDIVAEKGEELCFVEVKTRKLDSMVGGMESVDVRKQKLLIRAAYAYCQSMDIDENAWFIRYDIAEVTTWHDSIVNIDYLESAFDETDFHDNIQFY